MPKRDGSAGGWLLIILLGIVAIALVLSIFPGIRQAIFSIDTANWPIFTIIGSKILPFAGIAIAIYAIYLASKKGSEK